MRDLHDPTGVGRLHERGFGRGMTGVPTSRLAFIPAIPGACDKNESDDTETMRSVLRTGHTEIVVVGSSNDGSESLARLRPIDDVDVVAASTDADREIVTALCAGGDQIIRS